MTKVESLTPAQLYSARHHQGADAPTVDEAVIWYMELHPQADEAQVRAEISRRAKSLAK